MAGKAKQNNKTTAVAEDSNSHEKEHHGKGRNKHHPGKKQEDKKSSEPENASKTPLGTGWEEGSVSSRLLISSYTYFLSVNQEGKTAPPLPKDDDDFCPFKVKILSNDDTLDDRVKEYTDRPKERMKIDTPAIPTPRWTYLDVPQTQPRSKAKQSDGKSKKEKDKRKSESKPDRHSPTLASTDSETKEPPKAEEPIRKPEKTPFVFVANEIDPRDKENYLTLNKIFDAGVKKYKVYPERKREERLWQLPKPKTEDEPSEAEMAGDQTTVPTEPVAGELSSITTAPAAAIEA